MAEPLRKIDATVMVPLGAVGAVVVLITGLWSAVLIDRLGLKLDTRILGIENALHSVERSQAEARADHDKIRAELRDALSEGITDTEMDLWIERARAKGIDVPDRPTGRR